MKKMSPFFFAISISIFTSFSLHGQIIPKDSLYLGQLPPGNTPIVFQLPISLGTRPIERITISSDDKEIYYSEMDGYPPNILKINCYKYLNNKWQEPFVIFDGYMAPALSINDSIIYMQKNLNGTAATACTYYSTRNSTGWSIPTRLLSTNLATHYFRETNLKNYYLSTTFPGPSLRDISILFINGTDTIIKNLGAPISTSSNEGDFFIAKDESYIIHARSTPPMSGDLYISYKKADGNWTNSKSLGSKINLPNPSWEYGPFITQDNKYLFFSRGGITMSSYSTYWVKIDNIIDSLKHTNFVPYLKYQIPAQSIKVGNVFKYTVPDSTFVDDDGNNTLTYSATQSDGKPTPVWLSFDSGSRTFSGTPTEAVNVSIIVTATDNSNISVSCAFTIAITITGIENSKKKLPESINLYQNYPNPFNPTTTIEFAIPKTGRYKLGLYSTIGEIVKEITNKEYAAGYHKEIINAMGLSSGMYIYRLTGKDANIVRKMVLLR